MALTRQNVPVLDRNKFNPAAGTVNGAYVLADLGKSPEIILIASGSEVGLIVKAAEKLHAEGINVRIVSFPSWKLFEAQSQEYQDSVLLPNVKARLAVEMGVSQGWKRWVGDAGSCLCVNKFGASAPAKILFEKYGFTVENVVEQARKLIGR